MAGIAMLTDEVINGARNELNAATTVAVLLIDISS
jgi:hypothetical protein